MIYDIFVKTADGYLLYDTWKALPGIVQSRNGAFHAAEEARGKIVVYRSEMKQNL